jgi:hypothetical protein
MNFIFLKEQTKKKKKKLKEECDLFYFLKLQTYIQTNKNTKVNKRNILLQKIEKRKEKITTHFGFHKWVLRLHLSREGNMQLVIREFINLCCFTHLVAKDI